MKKIKWKKAKGGRAFEHILEGWVDGNHWFNIEGRSCVTDLRGIRQENWEPPKHYRIDDVENKREHAKQMAYEILNNINPEIYAENLRLQEVEAEHTRKVMQDAQDFLDRLKEKQDGKE